ncbi:MAG: hypothetical protein AAGD92_06845 [Pseudomonadota bacterium]
MSEFTEIEDNEYGKAAYAHSLFIETLMVNVIAQAALTANSADPASAARKMQENLAGAWNSPSLSKDGGDEIVTLMKGYSENFWSQVINGLALSTTQPSTKN